MPSISINKVTSIKFLLAIVLFCSAGFSPAQINNPFAEPVSKQGLSVEVRDVAQLPDTRGRYTAEQDRLYAARARIGFVRELADGRRFANDARGQLYFLENGTDALLYLDMAFRFPNSAYRDLQSGFIGFDFHPDFLNNGLFYTIHLENRRDDSPPPDFVPPGFTAADAPYHSVITEWLANDPTANRFIGSQREIFRGGQVANSFFHPFGFVGFDPTTEPGDPDYGLLYTSGSDLGFSNGGGPNAENPGQLQRLDTLTGAILRIDPRSPSETGGEKGAGDYTIPAINHYANDGDPNTLGEIYAHGFRNAHRLSWDYSDGTLYAADIGMSQVEEINIVVEGGNYGWMQREGIFDNAINYATGGLGLVYPLPEEIVTGEVEDEFSYPVVMYDHTEGLAITAGFAYRGSAPELQGKFIFGDIQRGRLFAADVAEMKAADDGIPETVAAIEEIQLYQLDANGNRRNVEFWDLVEESLGSSISRADLQISEGRDGEIFITSRQDGMIRVLGSE
jgi:hypothetical protein